MQCLPKIINIHVALIINDKICRFLAKFVPKPVVNSERFSLPGTMHNVEENMVKILILPFLWFLSSYHYHNNNGNNYDLVINAGIN